MKVSGYIGTEKIETAKQIRAGRNPGRLIEQAVRGMIPHNRLGRQIIAKLKVYKGAAHPHRAQQPIAVAI
jgi:large subunit ribosomal protein L13